MHRLNVFIFILLAIIVVSCAKEKEEGKRYGPSNVLLVYMGADNNLHTTVHRKLDAIREGWDGKENHKIVIYFDYKGASAELKEIRYDDRGNKTAARIAAYDRENSASAATLSRVISDVRARYPAARYGLLVFSHASGWLPEGALNHPGKEFRTGDSRSVIVDDSYGEMEICDFASAIPDSLFDYIVFEACFMAGIEVAYELRGKTPYILASSAEIVDPGFTPVYAVSISRLLDSDVQYFAQTAFDNVLTYAEGNLERSATFSVVHTSGLEQLARFIKDNCNFDREITLTTIQRFDRFDYRLFFDFEDYYGRLLDTDAQRAELSRLIRNCIAWKAATEQFMTQTAGYNGFFINIYSGLTTYIPQSQFPGLNVEYEKTSWANAIGNGLR